MASFNYRHKVRGLLYSACAIYSVGYSPLAFAGSGISVPINRSSLVNVQTPVKEVVIANPDITDVYVNNSKSLTFLGKSAGTTTVRLFDETGKLLQTMDVSVGYDLPAIRRALKKLIPDETIGVEMMNSSIALTGSIRNNSSTEKALKIVQEYISNASGGAANSATSAAPSADNPYPKIINMMKVISGQQVMLKVRVAEVNRDALKRLNVDPALVLAGGNFIADAALGTGISGLATGATSNFTLASSDNYRGTGGLFWQSNPNHRFGAQISALERDGLIKTLAEPNLVAVSGETAEFLAGGEIPVLTPSGGSGSTTVTIEYKPIGVSVKFTPDILSENRIRMSVLPEVSEVDSTNQINFSGFLIPSIKTRRAKTTVELAPGESFMIAGLLKDNSSATIDQLPGVKNLPILGALFRSTEFQRNESELVIAVTPYLVDPLKSSDVKLPTDDFRPASQMEMFFYGALGAVTSDGKSVTRMPQLEGPTGFMVD